MFVFLLRVGVCLCGVCVRCLCTGFVCRFVLVFACVLVCVGVLFL